MINQDNTDLGRHKNSFDVTNRAASYQELEKLIARCTLDDQGAFAELYDITSAKLFAVCVRVLKNQSAAEDALQDVYLKIWQNADRYIATGHAPMTWLITIARNTAIDRLRAQRKTADVAYYEDVLAAPGPTPEESAVASSHAQKLKLCLDELSEAKRKAVLGAYLYGFTYSELAQDTDVPINTIRTWLRRSLSALGKCMQR